MRSRTPPWPGISAELSFTPGAALEHRLEQIAGDAERDDGEAQADAKEDRHAGHPPRAGGHEQRRAEHEPADRALDGFLRADRRRQRPPPERAAGVVLRRVADHHGQHQQEQHARPGKRAHGDERADRQADVERGKQRRRDGRERVCAAAPRSERAQADRDERGHERHFERIPGLQADHAGGQQRRDQDRKRRHVQIAGRGQHDELAHAEHDEHRGEDRKTLSGANHTTPTASAIRAAPLRTRVIDGPPRACGLRIADCGLDCGFHLAPSATGDGLMPP